MMKTILFRPLVAFPPDPSFVGLCSILASVRSQVITAYFRYKYSFLILCGCICMSLFNSFFWDQVVTNRERRSQILQIQYRREKPTVCRTGVGISKGIGSY